jgi:heavy metal sensor kinase
MKYLKTLRVRFALWTAGWLLLVLVLLGTFIYISFARAQAQSIDDALRLTAAQILLDIDDETLRLENADTVANSTLREQFSLQILDLGGETRQRYGPYQDLPPQPIIAATADQSGAFTIFVDPTTQDSVRVYTIPIVEDERVLGTLQVAQSLVGVQQALNQLLTTLLIAGPIVVFLAGVGGYILAARALSPIDQITRTAGRISVEDLSARLNLPPTDDEVGRLAATFDTMLARLDDGFRRDRQFIADASHELRTPLATMQTILSSTLTRQRAPAEYEQALVDLAEETDRLKLLAEGLLLLARNDAYQSAAYEPIGLSTLLQDVIASLSPLAEDKNLIIEGRIPPNLNIVGDRDGLIRLFVNLLGNAIKYTEQGRITVSLCHDTDESIEVIIADTGVGIGPQHLPFIFDRFYRVEVSRTASGAGLGLAIALSVAQAHGGTISVTSEIERGTVFMVKLAKSSTPKNQLTPKKL